MSAKWHIVSFFSLVKLCASTKLAKNYIFLTLAELPISTRVTIQNHAFLAHLLIGIVVKGVKPKPCCRESIHMPALPWACHFSPKHIKKLCHNVREMCANCRFVRRAPSHFIDNPLAFGFSPGAVDMVWLLFPPVFALGNTRTKIMTPSISCAVGHVRLSHVVSKSYT